MRRLLVAGIALLMSAACTQADAGPDGEGVVAAASFAGYQPSASERAEIVGALQRVFDALDTGDAELLRSVMHPDVVMHFAETNAEGETSFGTSTLDGLASRIQSGGARLIERMWEPVVSTTGSLAMIWTPYDFYVGADFSHCGVDTATLVEGDDGWQIVALSWTRQQPPTCALHPEGPPSG